jgi:hypothetical protein
VFGSRLPRPTGMFGFVAELRPSGEIVKTSRFSYSDWVQSPYMIQPSSCEDSWNRNAAARCVRNATAGTFRILHLVGSTLMLFAIQREEVTMRVLLVEDEVLLAETIRQGARSRRFRGRHCPGWCCYAHNNYEPHD